MQTLSSRRRNSRLGYFAGPLFVLAAGLCGCGANYASSDPAQPVDVQARHPIVLATAPTSLDVFPIGRDLDPRSVADLNAFAARYQKFGSGAILILTPRRQASDARSVDQIRKTLARAGLRGSVAVSTYAPSDPTAAAPIRVVFMGLKAEVKTPCGLWPEDLASGSSLSGWKNEPYANFGCASQSVLAAQVDDPRDIVQSRVLAPADVAMRTRAIENVRKGQDPGTDWSTGLTPIGGN
jgi:pilus assembly protein CpaD